ncbi:AAA family ATPase, partial [Agrobacterium sp. MCAB5]
MYHRTNRQIFRTTSRNAGSFLMLCCIRKALRKTVQFRDNAPGIIVCVVDREWLWAGKAAATL